MAPDQPGHRAGAPDREVTENAVRRDDDLDTELQFHIDERARDPLPHVHRRRRVRGGGLDGAVAVISYGFWQRHFNGAADGVRRTPMVETVPFRVVFCGPEVAFDIAVPLGDEALLRGRKTTLDRPAGPDS